MKSELERIPFLETDRLFGYSLTLNDYQCLETGKEPEWLEFKNPYRHLVEGPSPLSHRIPKVKVNPEFAQIGIVLAVEKLTRFIIGSAGFHNLPDASGMIEIGFGIVPEKQNQGFGKELLLGMWRRISQRQDVRILRYTVSPLNAPSLHIIKKLNFELKGEQIDSEDGVELIYEKTLENFLSEGPLSAT